ncbi:MAG: DUF4272 domain-containing protein, partial [Myxococcaceae bacterium]
MSEDLEALSEQLASEEPEEREDAAQQLAELQDPKAAQYLHHALDDEADGVRMWGAYGLALLGRSADRESLQKAASSDDSPLVRLWANFGLTRMKDPAAAKALVAFLDDDSLELRVNAADALVSLDDPAPVNALLVKRMESEDPRERAWASGVLHALEHEGALEHWRESLLLPESRVDAALVAPFLQARSAARDLLKLLGELTQDELDEVAAGGELPLAEVLSRPLVELGLEELLEEAQSDVALRGEVVLVLLRGPAADPDVISQIHEFASELPPKILGKDVAALIAEQESSEHALLLARLATAVPDAVEHAAAGLEAPVREALFDALAESMTHGDDNSFELMPLLDVLRQSKYAEQFEDVPDSPEPPAPDQDMTAPEMPTFDPNAPAEEEFGEVGDTDDDITPLIERLASGEALSEDERKRGEEFLAEMGMTAEEFLEQVGSDPGDDEAPPPSGPEVAQRAMALGAMLKRSEVERRLSQGEMQRPDAQKQVQLIKKWMDEHLLLEILGPMEADLLDARTGDWTDDDRLLVDASGDALAMLLWAIGKVKAVGADEPVSISSLLKLLPLGTNPSAFVDGAELRGAEEIGRMAELWETWAWRVEQEDQARAVISEPDMELDLDVDALVGEIKKEGFDEKAASAKGKGHRAAEALRFLGKKAASRMVEEKLVPRLVNGDFGFKG